MRTPQISQSRGWLVAAAILVALVGWFGLPGQVRAAAGAHQHVHVPVNRAALKVVTYRGVPLTVPRSWPVIRLRSNSTVCVRFDRHAVYLGLPGSAQLCPPQAAGRTEAILASPERDARGVLTPAAGDAVGAGGASVARVVHRLRHVELTATWDRDPATIVRALGLRSLRALRRAADSYRPDAVPLPARPRAGARAVVPTDPATPGEVFSGLGFDACTAPSQSALSAWGTASPFGAVGIYIGGANMACSQANLTAAWVSAESAAGWHLIPTYVGLQAPTTSCRSCQKISASTAAAQGTAAALDAVAQAQALGIGTGNPIYFDMEAYTRTTAATAAVLAFLQAWTQQLHASDYLSGVYSSAASGISDLVTQAGTAYVEPDEIWVADWNGQQSTADSYVPTADWPNNQRLHQYQGAQTQSYGGVSINVDSDYLDGATAAAGSASAVPPAPVVAPSPSLTVTSHGDGSVDLTPQWTGEPGLTEFQFLGGTSASEMTPLQTVASTQSFPITVQAIYPYFEVQALGSSGQVLGTSVAVATPATVAVFSGTEFVSPRAKVAVAVACMNGLPCKVSTVIYSAGKRIANAGPESVSRHGGLIHIALGPRVYRKVTNALKNQLPVTLAVTNGAGATTRTSANLVAYSTSGRAPQTAAGAGPTLQVLGTTELVSNGWVGEVLVACTALSPCRTAMRVTTASGRVIARGKTPTVGAGEIAELHFQMTAKGHAMLRASSGNQLAARVVATSTPAGDDGASAVAGPLVTIARVSLVSY